METAPSRADALASDAAARRTAPRYGWRAMLLLLLAFLLFLLMGLLRHWSYLTQMHDLGAFDQVLWNTLQGDFMRNSFELPGGGSFNWLALHFNFILLVFVPLYALLATPLWLQLAQALALALALAVWPVYRLGQRWYGDERVALLWALLYVCNPFVLNAAAWDFHPLTLAVPCLAWAVLAIERGARGQLLACSVALMLIQEQLGLTVCGLGLLWGWRRREWRLVVLLLGLGLAHAALVLGLIMPGLSPTGAHPMLSEGQGQLSRYGWLGTGPGQMLLTVLRHPLAVAEIVFVDMGGALYLLLLLLPVLGLALLAPAWWLPGLADLAANLLSANPMPRNVMAYHSVTLALLMTLAGMRGLLTVAARLPGMTLRQWLGLVVLAGLLMGYLLAPLPLPGAMNAWQPAQLRWSPAHEVSQIRQLLGQGSLTAQANVGSQFAQRRELRVFDGRSQGSEHVVLWLESPTHNLLPANKISLAHHLAMAPADYLVAVSCLLDEPDYGIVYWQAHWLVLQRGARSDAARRDAVHARLARLAQLWPPAAASALPPACQ